LSDGLTVPESRQTLPDFRQFAPHPESAVCAQHHLRLEGSAKHCDNAIGDDFTTVPVHGKDRFMSITQKSGVTEAQRNRRRPIKSLTLDQMEDHIRSVFLDYMEKHGLARMNQLMFGKANNPTMRKRAEVRFKRFLEGKPYAVSRHRISMKWACRMGFKLGIPI